MTYIKIFTDLLEDIEPLDYEERGRLFTTMLMYSYIGAAPEMPGNERFIWPSIRKMIDREANNYQKMCERNKKNRNSSKKTVEEDTRIPDTTEANEGLTD